jgi:diaminopimelate epimerase
MGIPVVARGQCGGVEGVIVSTGNPHFVVFTAAEDFSSQGRSWLELGKEICEATQFVNGTNVEFVRVLGRDAIAIRIYERGAGPTSSSGTGSCAAAAAAMTTQGLSRTLSVHAPGGVQIVRWESAGEQMVLAGPADLIARGEFFL